MFEKVRNPQRSSPSSSSSSFTYSFSSSSYSFSLSSSSSLSLLSSSSTYSFSSMSSSYPSSSSSSSTYYSLEKIQIQRGFFGLSNVLLAFSYSDPDPHHFFSQVRIRIKMFQICHTADFRSGGVDTPNVPHHILYTLHTHHTEDTPITS